MRCPTSASMNLFLHSYASVRLCSSLQALRDCFLLAAARCCLHLLAPARACVRAGAHASETRCVSCALKLLSSGSRRRHVQAGTSRQEQAQASASRRKQAQAGARRRKQAKAAKIRPNPLQGGGPKPTTLDHIYIYMYILYIYIYIYTI